MAQHKTTFPAAHTPVAFQVRINDRFMTTPPFASRIKPCIRLGSRYVPRKKTKLWAFDPSENNVDVGYHTYVEGAEYGDFESELLSMGGDPSFLDTEEKSGRSQQDASDLDEIGGDLGFLKNNAEPFDLEEMGGDPNFFDSPTSDSEIDSTKLEWDKLKHGDAFNADEQEKCLTSQKTSGESNQSEIIPSKNNASPSEFSVLDDIEKFKSIQTMVKGTKAFEEDENKEQTAFDLEEMGGDPGFLSDYIEPFDLEESGGDPSFLDNATVDSYINSTKFEWDGTVNEDAYFDE